MKNTKEKCKKKKKNFLRFWWNLLRGNVNKKKTFLEGFQFLFNLYKYLLVHTSSSHLLQYVADMLLYRSTNSVTFVFDQ